MKNKKFFYILIFTVELSLLFIGFVIFFVFKKPIHMIFFMKENFLIQSVYGIILGFSLGFLSAFLVNKLKIFEIVKNLVLNVLREYKINIFDTILISLLAGICEEIFFRGILQQLTGLFISSFIFILLHGYFNPFSLNLTIFGLFMYILSLIIGISFESFGILCAILFHFTYDFIVLWYFKKIQLKV